MTPMTLQQHRDRMHELSTVGKGILGTVSTGGAITVSYLSAVEAWLRVGSLAVGFAVGLVTLYSLLKGKK